MMKKKITRKRLIELVLYDPISGRFEWRYSRGGHIKQAEPSYTIDARGYAVMSLDGQWYAAHRIAWLWVYAKWPKGDLDHANMVRRDNRINNLREATRGQNRHNSRPSKDNKSGTKGVTQLPSGRWMAQIQRNKKHHYLGVFDSKELAAWAYLQAAEKYFGEFARA